MPLFYMIVRVYPYSFGFMTIDSLSQAVYLVVIKYSVLSSAATYVLCGDHDYKN